MTNLVVRFMLFVSKFFIVIVGLLVILMAVTGVALVVVQGVTGMKFEVEKIWSGIGYVTATGSLGLAKPLKEFADFYIASTKNSKDKDAPPPEAFPPEYQAETRIERGEQNAQTGNS